MIDHALPPDDARRLVDSGGVGSFHDLCPISEDDWAAGLSQRFAADDCTIENGASERLIEYGELHSRSTVLIAQKTYLTIVESRTTAGRRDHRRRMAVHEFLFRR